MSGSHLNTVQKRLAYRVARRSMLEMDALLSPFFDPRIADFDDQMCARCERLLDLPDPDLYDWITGIKSVPEGVDRELIVQIAAAQGGRVRTGVA